ncbi:putative pectate lyase 3 [Bienertia sinuspersici]
MDNQSLIYLICSITFVATTLAHNNTWESDSYWQLRAQGARKRNMEAYNHNPFNVTNHINHHARMIFEDVMGLNSTRRKMMLSKKHIGLCTFYNPIDACWRCRPNWAQNRKRLAKCALGFGKGTIGGMVGRGYVVTDPSDDDLVNPKPGTLRHAVIQPEPLWIIFSKPMTIRLSQELIMTSHKTIDGRGANHVVIEGGAGITIQYVENIIIHGIKIRNIVPGSGGLIRDSIDHFGLRTESDGDAISIFGSHHIWIDHVSFSRCADGLIDVVEGSTAITISNCHMTDHDKVFLFGASNDQSDDRKMQVTVAYTHFGRGLVQRMPRCRYGFFHLVNNDYTHWVMYAIGGSQNPTIISQGNRFLPPPDPRVKEVTHREQPESAWDSGTWKSYQDYLLDGATFTESGNSIWYHPQEDQLINPIVHGRFAPQLTQFSGPLKCITNLPC